MSPVPATNQFHKNLIWYYSGLGSQPSVFQKALASSIPNLVISTITATEAETGE
jgi:hypothetical protein